MLQDYNVSLIHIHVNFIHWFMRCWGCNIWFILKCAEGDICVSIKMYKPCVNILWSFIRLKFFSPFLKNIFKSNSFPYHKIESSAMCFIQNFTLMNIFSLPTQRSSMSMLLYILYCKRVRCLSWMSLKFLHKNQFYFKP